MDSSWLLEEADVDSSESDKSDCEVEQEVESRLYSVIHHNDLSQPLPPELCRHYSLQQDDNGEVTVTLKHPLEEVKFEEIKHINDILEPHDPANEKLAEAAEVVEIPNDDKDDDVIIVSEVIHNLNPNKKFRYSDVDIHQWDEFQKSGYHIGNFNNVNESTLGKTSDLCKNIDGVDKLRKYLSKKYREFSDVNFPSYLDLSDWKSSSNSSFIPIGIEDNGKYPIFKQKFIRSLKQVNPHMSNKKLKRLSHIIFNMNTDIVNQKGKNKIRNRMRKNLINGLDIMTNYQLFSNKMPLLEDKRVEDNEVVFHKSAQDNVNNMSLNISPSMIDSPSINTFNNNQHSTSRKKKKINGSVSLKSSPFRPTQLSSEIDSEDENTVSNNETKLSSEPKSISHLPTKWSKQMIAYYTKPSNKKLQKNINSFFNHFKKTTTAEDWLLDPRDESGVYHRPEVVTTNNQRRCANCNQRDHMTRNCPEPKKKTVCFLCGYYNHDAFNCYNTVCIKCGEYAQSGECEKCYYEAFQFNTRCKRCGSVLHSTLLCPDSWRSYHATTGGDLKIPKTQKENRRKCCCNCGHQGHFSHKCPMPSYAGQQINPFVTNYSDEILQEGATEIFLSRNFQEIINCPQAEKFFQNLSNTSNAVILMDEQYQGYSIKIKGTFEQCLDVKSKIEGYVNTRKRKREEPPIRRKRRRLK